MKRINSWKEMEVGKIYKIIYCGVSKPYTITIQKLNRIIPKHKSKSGEVELKMTFLFANRFFAVGDTGWDVGEDINNKLNVWEINKDEVMLELL